MTQPKLTVISASLTPLADLHPADWNPRRIEKDRFDQLKKAIQSDPQFLALRPVLASQDGTIYAGNMRYRAAEALGWKDIPAIITDIDEVTAKKRALQDNNQFGEWVDTELSELMQELASAEIDIQSLGFSQKELDDIIGNIPEFKEESAEEQGKLDEKTPITCPNCGKDFTP